MTDGGPARLPSGPAAEGDVADIELVETPWSVGSALSLVLVAFVLALLAGAAIADMGRAGWSPVVRTLCAGGVLLGLYAVLLGIVWVASARFGVRLADAVGLARAAGASWYVAAVGAAVVGWLFSAAFTTMLAALGVELPREDLAVFRLLPSGLSGFAITILLLVVVAPFAEEVVYRGVLLSALSSRWGTAVGLVASTVVFSAVHLSLVGFVPLLVAGALFGSLFIKSRSLRVAIVAHAVYNALGVMALLVSKPGIL